MPELLGPDGQPIDLSKLREEQAAPTLTGIRQIIGGHPSRGLTPARLASLLVEAEQGDATRYLELAEEMEEKDLHYLGVMGTRKRAVAQLEITVEPASDSAEHMRHAELIKEFIGREELEDELFDILDAVGKGYSVTEIIWDMSERQWMPRRLEWRFPQWFEHDRESGKRLMLRTESGLEPLAGFKFITHHHKAKTGLPIRGGIARAIAWGYLFKNYTIKDWVAFIEIYGQPLRVGKYDKAATPEEKDTLLRAVANIGQDAAAIIPQSMLIEFIKTEQRGTSDLYERFAAYIDANISKAILGQTLTTEVKGGSFAAAKVHDGVREDIERADAKQTAASMNRDLVCPAIDLNFGPQDEYPKIFIGRPEQTDVPELADALQKLVPLGLRVRQSEVRQKVNLSDPEETDELLVPPSAPTPGSEPESEPDNATATAAADVDDDDSIDRLVEEELARGGWEKLLGPAVDEIRGLAGDTDDYETFRARLAERLDDDAIETITDALAKAAFSSRIAGNVGADINDEN